MRRNILLIYLNICCSHTLIFDHSHKHYFIGKSTIFCGKFISTIRCTILTRDSLLSLSKLIASKLAKTCCSISTYLKIFIRNILTCPLKLFLKIILLFLLKNFLKIIIIRPISHWSICRDPRNSAAQTSAFIIITNFYASMTS